MASTEVSSLYTTAGFLDLSDRSRLCVLGADRAKFLHGQVTNNVTALKPGHGCYAALVSAKGKIQSDLHIYALENELLLEFEPGMAATVRERLEKYVIAEDVELVDVAPHYGLFTVQGPKAADVISSLPWKFVLPTAKNGITKLEDAMLGEAYLTQRDRTAAGGYDLYIPTDKMAAVTEALEQVAPKLDPTALETARIEAGLPRHGVDMDENNLAPEALGADAISYAKGCYIGQEVIARVRTYGQVAKALRGLELNAVCQAGDKIYNGDKEVGYITSATLSPRSQKHIALGYVRRESNEVGTELTVLHGTDKVAARIVPLPFAL